MSPSDAEMPATPHLRDDFNQIAKDIASLREDLDTLRGHVGRIGAHQIEHLQSTANAAFAELTGAVRRNPLTALAIAAALGFIYGVIRR
jgi:ElaB/YqjD/DUF883 family membrane-anchored ribosome-binding protein